MKTLMTTLALAGLTAGSLGATANTISTCAVDGDSRAIAESYNTRWLAALRAGDDAQLSTLYTESAVLMPPSDETIVGAAPISNYLASHGVPAKEAAYAVDLVSCEVRGNALHIAGVWGARVPGADTALVTGNVLRVLEPGRDGRWIASYEIWN